MSSEPVVAGVSGGKSNGLHAYGVNPIRYAPQLYSKANLKG